MISRFAVILALTLPLAAHATSPDEKAQIEFPASPTNDPVELYRRDCMMIVVTKWKTMLDNTEDKSVFRGTATIAFDILPEGRPKNFEIVEQSADAEAIRRTGMMAAAMSRFSPTPQEVLDKLEGKALRITIEFGLKQKTPKQDSTAKP